MRRMGQWRLSEDGVAAIQMKYRQDRWDSIDAFCVEKGISRSVYFELIGRKKWSKRKTLEAHLHDMGISDTDNGRYFECKEQEPRPTHNLPSPTTTFIGREKDIAEVKRLLATTRLLTLTGAGGSGKTRLSLQVAADMLNDYPDGVWLVELAALSDPALVAQTVATALDIREEAGKSLTQTLVTALKPKRLLLALDNCEHLIPACASLVAEILCACPKVKILATSREFLNLVNAGECVWKVPSLSYPDPKRLQKDEKDLDAALAEYDAVRLFVERARAVRSDFALTRQNSAEVATICQRLDGIPLALELAAAWTRSLTVQLLLERLGERFDLLTSGSQATPPRHQTLRALIDWSCDLLQDREKTLFRRLSMFAGGWTLEAAEQVCAGDGIEIGEVIHLLTSLADKSLVAFDAQEAQGRYALLETIRLYGQERLAQMGETLALQERHQNYFLALAEEAEPRLTGTEQAAWLARLEAESDNLRTALERSKEEGGTEAGLRLAGALWRFWDVHGYWSAGRAYLAEALGYEAAAGGTPMRARALTGAGMLAWNQGDYRSARELHEESLAIYRELDDRQGIAASLNNLGNVAYDQGDYPSARALHQESLTLRRALEDGHGVAASLNNLGIVAHDQGDYKSARALHQESLKIKRELGDRQGIAASLNNLGNVAFDQGDCAAAKALHQESLAIRQELGNRGGIAYSLNNLGNIASAQAAYDSAKRLYSESLEIKRRLGDRWGIAFSLKAFADLAAAQSQWGRAAQLWGAAEALRESLHSPLPPREQEKYDCSVSAVRGTVGEEAFARAWQEGCAMTLEQAIHSAFETNRPTAPTSQEPVF